MTQMEEASKKRRQRRSYTDEFRAGAVRLVLDDGKALSRVAQDLDLTASALGSWVKQARADRSNGKTGLTTEERAELAQLRRKTHAADGEVFYNRQRRHSSLDYVSPAEYEKNRRLTLAA
jgi:transposase